MKVLLCEDVKDLGWLGDVVEVADGYARNYLLPQQLAMVPTEANLRSLADEKARRSEQRLQECERIERASSSVDGAEAVVAAKANELGHLFGSVGRRDIAANLRAQGFEVADEVVELAHPIKEVGTSQVTLKFTEELKATVNVVVVAAGAEGAAAAEGDEGAMETVQGSAEGDAKAGTGEMSEKADESAEA